jgi:hypothetical protein
MLICGAVDPGVILTKWNFPNNLGHVNFIGDLLPWKNKHTFA